MCLYIYSNTTLSNNGLAELLNLTTNHVSKLVSSLSNKKYIKVHLKYKKDSKEIEHRILKPIFKIDNRYNLKQQFTYNQNGLPPILKMIKILIIIFLIITIQKRRRNISNGN